MINRDEVMPLIIASCPSFAEVWDPNEHVDGGDRLLYLDAADFNRHVLDLIAAGDRDELDSAFDVIERLHVDGDAFVRELATIGILEGFQSASASSRGIDPDVGVTPWLRPESLRWWEKLNRFWSGDASALEEEP